MGLFVNNFPLGKFSIRDSHLYGNGNTTRVVKLKFLMFSTSEADFLLISRFNLCVSVCDSASGDCSRSSCGRGVWCWPHGGAGEDPPVAAPQAGSFCRDLLLSWGVLRERIGGQNPAVLYRRQIIPFLRSADMSDWAQNMRSWAGSHPELDHYTLLTAGWKDMKTIRWSSDWYFWY